MSQEDAIGPAKEAELRLLARLMVDEIFTRFRAASESLSGNIGPRRTEPCTPHRAEPEVIPPVDPEAIRAEARQAIRDGRAGRRR